MNRQPPRGSSAQTPLWLVVLLGLLLVVALVIRIWFATADLSRERFWDERYSFQNVHGLVAEGKLVPRTGYYPILNHLPQSLTLVGMDWMHRRTGSESWAVFRWPGARREVPTLGWVMHLYTPRARVVGRIFPVLYGVVGLGMLFLIGRQIDTPLAGLVSAALLAAAGWHVTISSVFKPDALVVLLMLVAFAASVAALSRPPDWRRYLICGVLIALAPSAKLTGGTIAIPLVLGSLLLSRREPRRIGLLVLAGSVSAVTFLAINPFFRKYLWYLGVLKRFYARRADQLDMDSSEVFLRGLVLPLRDTAFGPLGTVLVTLGGVVLLSWLVHGVIGRRRWRRAVVAIVLLTFPVLFLGLYAWQTPYYKANNLLPVLAFLALWGGVGGAWIVKQLGKLLPEPVAALPGALLAVLIVTHALVSPYRFVAEAVVPSTSRKAVQFTGQRLTKLPGPVAWRQLLMETAVLRDLGAPRGGQHALLFEVEKPGEISADELSRFDGAILRRRAMPRAPGFVAWLSRLPRRDLRWFEPDWLEVRGARLVAGVSRRWEWMGKSPLQLEPATSGWNVAVPDTAPGGAVSLLVVCPSDMGSLLNQATVLVAGRGIRITTFRAGRGGRALATERFRAPGQAIRVQLHLGREVRSPGRCRATSARWRHSSAAAAERR